MQGGGNDVIGLLPTFTTTSQCCGAAHHCGHSC
jgi:hypothetical protein